MTQTAGAISAKDVKVELSSQDISGSSNKVELSPELESGDTYTFDGDWRLVLGGKLKWAGKLTAVYTEVTNEAVDKIWAAFIGQVPVALAVSPKGGTAGDWEFSGNILITKAPIQLDGTKSGDPVLMEVEFEGSGVLTKAAVATT